MYAYIYVCTHIWKYIYIIYAFLYTNAIHTYKHTYGYIHTTVVQCIGVSALHYVHTHTYIHMHIHTHSFLVMPLDAWGFQLSIHTYIHTYTWSLSNAMYPLLDAWGFQDPNPSPPRFPVINVCMYAYAWCMRVCMYVSCMYVCMYACMKPIVLHLLFLQGNGTSIYTCASMYSCMPYTDMHVL